jgi:hypothetical protein
MAGAAKRCWLRADVPGSPLLRPRPPNLVPPRPIWAVAGAHRGAGEIRGRAGQPSAASGVSTAAALSRELSAYRDQHRCRLLEASSKHPRRKP